jgi:hypothetical protein
MGVREKMLLLIYSLTCKPLLDLMIFEQNMVECSLTFGKNM